MPAVQMDCREPEMEQGCGAVTDRTTAPLSAPIATGSGACGSEGPIKVVFYVSHALSDGTHRDSTQGAEHAVVPSYGVMACKGVAQGREVKFCLVSASAR